VRNIRLTIAYDGTAYSGWQVQPDAPSVQGTIESAIQQLTGAEIRVHGSGRTDAGVHALGQVAHFHTEATIPPERWRHALNGALPPDIVIARSEEVPVEFHARYSAKRKTYQYLIHRVVAPFPLPWLCSHTWQIVVDADPSAGGNLWELDLKEMRRAARCLVGRHDFSSFESKSSPDESSVRTIFDLSVNHLPRWQPWSPQALSHFPAEAVSVSITADGFLYNMVRSIVGTLVEVGQGRRSRTDMQRILEARDRSQAGPTAPPQGLYLMSVDYGS
jgi:tRNA pseudouridine38-40 synthase